MPQTKIIATVGPASDRREIIASMMDRGLSCVRINTAHIQAGYIGKKSDYQNEHSEKDIAGYTACTVAYDPRFSHFIKPAHTHIPGYTL